MEGQLNFFLMHIKVAMNIINMGFRLVRLVTVRCTVYTLHAQQIVCMGKLHCIQKNNYGITNQAKNNCSRI